MKYTVYYAGFFQINCSCLHDNGIEKSELLSRRKTTESLRLLIIFLKLCTRCY